MQAIILAAGIGRRLRYETAERPKCMVEVSGVSILQRSLDSISLFPISRMEYPARLGEKRIVPLQPPSKGLRYPARRVFV